MSKNDIPTVDMVKIKYCTLPGGKTAWQPIGEIYPRPFDLVEIKTENQIKPGWWDGRKWVGLRIKPSDTLNSWRVMDELEVIQ